MAKHQQAEPPAGWLVAKADARMVEQLRGARGREGWILLRFDVAVQAFVFAAGAFVSRWYAVRRARQLEERRRQWLWGEIDRRLTSFGAPS